jgi:hypothetical protein
MPKDRYWLSPAKCDVCNNTTMPQMVDGKTHQGPWALMCGPCYKVLGVGIGQGNGQLYDRQSDGKYLKTAG